MTRGRPAANVRVMADALAPSRSPPPPHAVRDAIRAGNPALAHELLVDAANRSGSGAADGACHAEQGFGRPALGAGRAATPSILARLEVGDTVAWAEVPDGAMVRVRVRDGDDYFAVRQHGRGAWVFGCDREWCEGVRAKDVNQPLRRGWAWADGEPQMVTIIATGLTGTETAADLQRLAEVSHARA